MANTQDRYYFERFDVYRVATEALMLVVDARGLLRGRASDLAPQLERAAVRMVANVGESCGRGSHPDRRRVLAIARGEANEAGALVEIASMLGAFSDEQHAALRSRLLRVTYMLTAMMR
jgi:four helix bundle protein